MGVRQQRRDETRVAILAAARRQLVSGGPAALSLRAVARELDVAASALYRYYADRDDLLTALIVDAYRECADAVEAALLSVGGPRSTRPARAFVAAALAYREWARANPSQFLLVFGTPVPGYHAPRDRTFPAGTRIPRLLCTLLVDARPLLTLPRSTRSALRDLVQALEVDVDPAALAAGMQAWDAVHGHVMFELSGQLGDLAGDDGLFVSLARRQSALVGL